ncbi:transporter substrate-binding domain-containing protein [Marinobacteraceae bacterium S3BR75-40.1]
MLFWTRLSPAEECRSIRVTSDPDYPPLSWRDPQRPDRIIGVAIDLAERAFSDAGVDVESVYVGPWKRVLANHEKVDLIAGLYLTHERESFLRYVQPAFMSDPSVVFVKKGEGFSFTQWNDLVKHDGGIRLGDSFGHDFDVFAGKRLMLEEVRSFGQLAGMTLAGYLDYFIYGLYPGLVMIKQQGLEGKLEYLPLPISQEPVFMAFSKTSSCQHLAEHLQHKLRQFVAEGLPERLSSEYLQRWEQQH